MRIDFLHLFRSLRRSPASAIAAVLTLSLTLGAGTAIFAVVDAVLLTPPPFTDPAQLYLVGEEPVDLDGFIETRINRGGPPRTVSYEHFEGWRETATSLAALEAFDGTNVTLTEIGDAERLSVTDTTPGFLSLLGVVPTMGRAFNPDDVGQPVVVVSHSFWRGKLGADPGAIGRELMLGGRRHTIVGVLPERFFFAFNPSEIWRPLPLLTDPSARRNYQVLAVARLQVGAPAASLEAAVNDPRRGSATAQKRNVAMPMTTVIAGDSPRTINLLAGAAALAILIACANLAGLVLVRSIDRERELAVRTALGARRSEIARQLLLETLPLVVVGTIGGVLLAWWLTPIAGRLMLEQFGAIANRDVAMGWRMVVFVAILATACAAVAAWLPMLTSGQRNVVETLRRGITHAPRERSVRRMLVAGEVALAFVLTVCVSLLGGSLWRLLKVDPGFDADGVLALQLSVPAAKYPDAARVATFYRTLQDALEDRLGPRAVAIVNEVPLTGDGGRRIIAEVNGRGAVEPVVREASPRFFDVMRMSTLVGRGFESTDDSSGPPRVLVSQSLAERLLGSNPIGRQVAGLARNPPEAEVIGVVSDVKHRALDEPVVPTLYLSALQSPSRNTVLVVRGAQPDAVVIAAVREEVARLDGNLPVYRIRSMREIVNASPGVPARRVLTATFTAFAVLGVVLGAIGLFGVVAHDVARRRAELALRMALGADPGRILRTTLKQGAWMVGVGLMAGSLLSFWATRALNTMLFAPDPLDVVSVAAAALLLFLVGIGAVLPASLRAARTDPMIAIRAE
jgi:putative ABC transport system permease protein